MAGKGQRRREKNFAAAHGSNIRLPPPPNQREIDAIPSKLRKIIKFKNREAGPKQTLAEREASKGGAAASKKKANHEHQNSSTDLSLKVGDDINKTNSGKHTAEKDTTIAPNSGNGGKRKRKRKEANDLRFRELDEATAQLKKKPRRKAYLEARKKKHKKAKKDDSMDFPGHENIEFGEVVVAPPKLSFPKAIFTAKTSLDASRERARLQAIDSYRNRRGWVTRPGMQLPALPET